MRLGGAARRLSGEFCAPSTGSKYSDWWIASITRIKQELQNTILLLKFGAQVIDRAHGPALKVLASHYVYDRVGHLISEADSTGQGLREYVWLDDMPLAVVADINTSPHLYFAHTDHLDCPFPNIAPLLQANMAAWSDTGATSFLASLTSYVDARGSPVIGPGDHVDALRAALIARLRSTPSLFYGTILHTVLTLPPHDADDQGRWRLIKTLFSKAVLAAGASVRRHATMSLRYGSGGSSNT